MTAIVPGLCSVTFRALAPAAVIDLADRAGLAAIEWGADLHVPPGQPDAARALAGRCADAGLACPSYGAYWFAGRSDRSELDPILDTAEALGASLLRVWAPFGVGPDAGDEERRGVADALRGCLEIATRRGVRVALEFHPGTLTETADSALDLLARCEGVLSYWQPRPGDGAEAALPELEAVAARLAHLHVFSWGADPTDRRALSHRETLWRRALRAASTAPSPMDARCAYLEFVRDDSPEAFLDDAASLRRLIGGETA